MYWIRNGNTGAAVVNRALQVLYFPRYSDAYMFIHKRLLNEKNIRYNSNSVQLFHVKQWEGVGRNEKM